MTPDISVTLNIKYTANLQFNVINSNNLNELKVLVKCIPILISYTIYIIIRRF